MHMGMSQESFCAEICRENAVSVSRGKHFVRACAVEMHKMHMDRSQEAFCAEIYRENAKRDRYHLDWTPGLNTYRKNPFSVATMFGEKVLNLSGKNTILMGTHGGSRYMFYCLLFGRRFGGAHSLDQLSNWRTRWYPDPICSSSSLNFCVSFPYQNRHHFWVRQLG